MPILCHVCPVGLKKVNAEPGCIKVERCSYGFTNEEEKSEVTLETEEQGYKPLLSTQEGFLGRKNASHLSCSPGWVRTISFFQ